jgi:hypothetical protein
LDGGRDRNNSELSRLLDVGYRHDLGIEDASVALALIYVTAAHTRGGGAARECPGWRSGRLK